MTPAPQPSDILAFWFGDDPATQRDEWFEKSVDFDTSCARFGAAIRAARSGAFDHWAATPRGALALIVLLDQLSRNVFRDAAEAFAADARALAVARRAIEIGFDTVLTPVERMFLYLPFEHSENLTDQDESVRLSETLRAALGDDSVDYAYRHRDVIQRFGRFPHRNAALGRISTDAEAEYLAQPGAGF
jgi:uncharacterized protein (DUF924 family)